MLFISSASFAKVPPSLFVLLGALQKLISVDVPLTKDILWILVNKTIKPNEHASNLVYTALQHLFDVVGVGCQEIYQHLRNENIEISPKLLMNVRRERKVLQLRAKLAAHVSKVTSRLYIHICLSGLMLFLLCRKCRASLPKFLLTKILALLFNFHRLRKIQK